MSGIATVKRPLADVLAAGAVVTRRGGQVLLVHRPRYDDWSFPKGKLDRGEHLAAAAVREVAEETGVDIRLGAPLRGQRYAAGNRMKAVSYWMGRVVGDDDVTSYQPNAEIDDVAWVSADDAMALLTYPYDRETLREAMAMRKKTHAFVVLRHGAARARGGWRRDDRERPLVKAGVLQAEHIVPLLAAYDVTVLASSSSLRCVATLQPYADVTSRKLLEYDGLSEEAATADSVLQIVEELRELKQGVVVCTHRPVLPTVFDVLGLPEAPLDPGDLLVVHHRKGRVVATEHHRIH